ncbi:MAG: hypothetical protein FWG87_07235 [Defluviitaleaceae bacterium]|nr:hypothetical protein [Defluviitaleaceae bacterium]
MAETINVTIRLDREVKEQTELDRRIADIEAGRATFVVKTMEELEAMAK